MKLTKTLKLLCFVLVLLIVIQEVSARPSIKVSQRMAQQDKNTKLNDVAKNLKDKLDNKKDLNAFDRYILTIAVKYPKFLKIFDLNRIDHRQHQSWYVQFG